MVLVFLETLAAPTNRDDSETINENYVHHDIFSDLQQAIVYDIASLFFVVLVCLGLRDTRSRDKRVYIIIEKGRTTSSFLLLR